MHLIIWKKTKVQNKFQIKSTIIITIVTKTSKPYNVHVNVVVVAMACSQVPEQQVLKECEPVKAKSIVNWQT
jgi:hypothetical protein